jgi:uncharacterized protein
MKRSRSAAARRTGTRRPRLIRRIADVRRLAEKRAEENWRFRCALKTCTISSRRIDSLIHRLYRGIAERIDCTACANCCIEISPVLDKRDVERLSVGLGLSARDLRRKWLAYDRIAGGFVLNVKPCPFLRGKRCGVYEYRPEDCRSYPHLHKKNLVFRSIDLYSNCSVCPISFNVYEGVKRELGDRLARGPGDPDWLA